MRYSPAPIAAASGFFRSCAICAEKRPRVAKRSSPARSALLLVRNSQPATVSTRESAVKAITRAPSWPLNALKIAR